MNSNDKVNIYYDAEFTSLTVDAQLISIGLVSQSGNWFYAEFTDYDENNLDEWITENVISNLVLTEHDPNTTKVNNDGIEVKGTSEYIADKLLEWLKKEAGDKQIQIYCDCYAYDWMLFNKLICRDGNALNIPEFIYYIPMDLSTALAMKKIDPDINREEFVYNHTIHIYDVKYLNRHFPYGMNLKHNSLWDAFICEFAFISLDQMMIW